MKVLVTGGAGFIGSHIVEHLLKISAKVVVLDNFSGGSLENIPAGVPHVEMDIRDPQLIEWMKGESFDYVIHQAAQTSVPYSLEHPMEDCQINILGLVNLMEGARLSGVKRVLFASTAAIYGDTEIFPIKEDAPKNPLSFYGLSKWTEEQYLALYQQTFGIEYVILRYANVYGERQGTKGEGGVIDIFSRKILKNEALSVYGDGEQTRDFIYAGDVAAANIKALLTSYPNRAYNISNTSECTLNELISVFGSLEKQDLAVNYLPPRTGDILRSVLDSSDAQQLLNWKPEVKLAEGLNALLTYIRTHD